MLHPPRTVRRNLPFIKASEGTPKIWQDNELYNIHLLPSGLNESILYQLPEECPPKAVISIVTKNKSNVFLAQQSKDKEHKFKGWSEGSLNSSLGTETQWKIMQKDNVQEKIKTGKSGCDLDIIYYKKANSGETIRLPVLTHYLRGAIFEKEGKKSFFSSVKF